MSRDDYPDHFRLYSLQFVEKFGAFHVWQFDVDEGDVERRFFTGLDCLLAVFHGFNQVSSSPSTVESMVLTPASSSTTRMLVSMIDHLALFLPLPLQAFK